MSGKKSQYAYMYVFSVLVTCRLHLKSNQMNKITYLIKLYYFKFCVMIYTKYEGHPISNANVSVFQSLPNLYVSICVLNIIISNIIKVQRNIKPL